MPAEFHFLRPGWLAILPAAGLLLWWWLRARSRGGAWKRLVDPGLQAYVLISGNAATNLRWPVGVAAGVIVCAAIALAGPSFERLPVPAYRTDSALVVALDLSRSMDATDVAPSRLARAKLKLLSLLERREEGETALVVFSAHAFTVTPLTTDTSTVAALVGSVSTDIMPSQGSYAAAGIEKAAELLRQAGYQRGDIIVFSDAEVDDDAIVAARELRAQGYRISVLAVGTEEGAPIPAAEGGFVTDRTGDVVIPRTDLDGLQRLAGVGGGRYAQLAPDDSDLDRLVPSQLLAANVADGAQSDEDDFSADVWRDEGIWFAVALLPLLAVAFRRGWVCVLAIAALGYGEPSFAFEWADLWQRPDQRGQEALEAGDASAAAQLFEDPQWRGAAQYRAAEYAESADTLAPVDAAEAVYNRGNALARSGQLEAAIAQYDAVLESVPDHEDAIYNRELVRELLEQQQQQQQQQQEQQQAGDQDQQNADNSGENESDAGEQASQQASESGDSQQNSESSDAEQQPPEQSAQNDEDPSGEPEQQDETGEAEQLSAALPEDIEEWASEQAADQWLRRVPQDPGGLLRRKFYYQYQRLGLDQDGRYVWPGNESEPW